MLDDPAGRSRASPRAEAVQAGPLPGTAADAGRPRADAAGRPRLVEAARPDRAAAVPRPGGRPRRRSPTAWTSGSPPGGPCRSSSARLLVPAGTADDPAGKSGLATLTATLLDKGTKDQDRHRAGRGARDPRRHRSRRRRPSTDTRRSASASWPGTSTPALALIGQMLAAPRFDPKDFDRERQLQLDRPAPGARRPVTGSPSGPSASLLYGRDHPYGNPAQGYPETVKGLTLDDVRAFHAHSFAPDRLDPDRRRRRRARRPDRDPGSDPRRLEDDRPRAPKPRPAADGQGRARRRLPRRQAGGRAERPAASAAAGSTARTRATSPP